MKKKEKTLRLISYCLIVTGVLLLFAIHFAGVPHPDYRPLILTLVKGYVWLVVVYNCVYLIVKKRSKG